MGMVIVCDIVAVVSIEIVRSICIYSTGRLDPVTGFPSEDISLAVLGFKLVLRPPSVS